MFSSNKSLLTKKSTEHQIAAKPTLIGVFDSGIGGLTVVEAICNYLPEQKFLYIGDNANCPWGDKSRAQIIAYTDKLVDFLIKHNCGIIVIACNTASCIALPYIKKKLAQARVRAKANVPPLKQIKLFEIIAPTISLLSRMKLNDFKEIGIIGTHQTIDSRVYQDKFKKLQDDLIIKRKIVIKSLATPLLVPLIEENCLKHQFMDLIVAKYLTKLNLKNNSMLILACTHYPLIKKHIENYYQNIHKNITIIDPSILIAKEIQGYLDQDLIVQSKSRSNVIHNQQNSSNFYYTEHSKPFLQVVKKKFPKFEFQFLPLWK